MLARRVSEASEDSASRLTKSGRTSYLSSMCLLAILYRMFDDAPVVLAANREEDYARGGTGLDLRFGPIPFIAGVDPVAGGTWLGINAARLIVAVTNRPKSKLPASPRSRGLLVRDLLGLHSASEAARKAAIELAADRYGGCNIVCADLESLWVVHAGDWLRARSLSPGIHVLTNSDVNDVADERVYWGLERLHGEGPRTSDEGLAALRSVASHSAPPTPICRRGATRGTVSGTLLALHDRPRRSRLFHAQGSPAEVPYADRTDLLWELENLSPGKEIGR
jgi:hypothetical protein